MTFIRSIAVSVVCAVTTTAAAQPVLITSPTTLNHGATTIIDQGTGSPVPLATAHITVRGTTLTMNGEHTIASLRLERSPANQPGILTHAAAYSYMDAQGQTHFGMNLEVAGDVWIQGAIGSLVGSQIDVSGRGHDLTAAGGGGPGAGGTVGTGGAGGGGHGGRGGNGSPGQGGGSYGSLTQPQTLGSAGGGHGNNPDGGRGGGAVRLSVAGTLHIDGAVRANGHQPAQYRGGGAAGSIWIHCGALTGSGLISADGGMATGGTFGPTGGGGGGRIAVYTCARQLDASRIVANGGAVAIGQNGQPGTIYFGSGSMSPPPNIVSQPMAAPTCVGSGAAFSVFAAACGPMSYHWRRNGSPIDATLNPSAATPTLVLQSVQASDAGWYDVVVSADGNTAVSNAAALDVYCDCQQLAPIVAGIDDNFAMPAETTVPSPSLVDALLNNRPNRPFHQFDEIPREGSSIPEDSRLAHTFGNLPPGIAGAQLTLRVRAGGDGTVTPVAEGTDSIRLGFATGQGAGAVENRAWERRFGGTAADPNSGLLAGQIWTSGDTALLTLDLAALPLDRPLGDPTGQVMSLLPQLRAAGFLDVTVVDETGVDFMSLVLQTSSGQVRPWVIGPAGDVPAAAGERVELAARPGAGGEPFTFQWRHNGVAIDPGTNPTAAAATLVLDPVRRADAGTYDCIVAGANTCGTAATSPITLSVSGGCAADWDGNGVVNSGDISAFLTTWLASVQTGTLAGDFNADGQTNSSDISAFLTVWLGAVQGGC